MFSFIGIKNRLQAIGNSYSLKVGEGKCIIVQSEINSRITTCDTSISGGNWTADVARYNSWYVDVELSDRSRSREQLIDVAHLLLYNSAQCSVPINAHITV